MPSPTPWLLALDETGDFEDPTARVCIAGVLVQSHDNLEVRRTLRSMIELVYPCVPYPPHATVLNSPAGLLGGWILTHSRRGDPEFDHAAGERMALYLLGSEAPEFAKYRDAIASGRMPRQDAAFRADDRLSRSAGQDWYTLLQYRDLTARRMRGLLARLDSHFGPGRCFAVGAASLPEASCEDVPANPQEDRYCALLVPLLQRVGNLLASPAGDRHQISICAATRPTRVGGRPRLLRPADFRGCIERAIAGPTPFAASIADTGVGFRVEEVAEYNETVHPAIVLADFIANRTGKVLTAQSWDLFGQKLRERANLPAERTARWAGRSLPSFDADGLVHDAVTEALSGQSPRAVDAANPGWTRDQARVWLEAIAAVELESR